MSTTAVPAVLTLRVHPLDFPYLLVGCLETMRTTELDYRIPVPTSLRPSSGVIPVSGKDRDRAVEYIGRWLYNRGVPYEVVRGAVELAEPSKALRCLAILNNLLDDGILEKARAIARVYAPVPGGARLRVGDLKSFLASWSPQLVWETIRGVNAYLDALPPDGSGLSAAALSNAGEVVSELAQEAQAVKRQYGKLNESNQRWVEAGGDDDLSRLIDVEIPLTQKRLEVYTGYTLPALKRYQDAVAGRKAIGEFEQRGLLRSLGQARSEIQVTLSLVRADGPHALALQGFRVALEKDIALLEGLIDQVSDYDPPARSGLTFKEGPFPDLEKAEFQPRFDGASGVKELFIDDEGREWLVKSNQSPLRPYIEDWAYGLRRALGLPAPASFIPRPTQFAQQLYRGAKSLDEIPVPQAWADLLREDIFAWLIGDPDRHKGNMLRLRDGRVVGIDFAAANPFYASYAYNMWGEGLRELIEDIRANRVRNELSEADLYAVLELIDAIENMPEHRLRELMDPLLDERWDNQFERDAQFEVFLERRRGLRAAWDRQAEKLADEFGLDYDPDAFYAGRAGAGVTEPFLDVDIDGVGYTLRRVDPDDAYVPRPDGVQQKEMLRDQTGGLWIIKYGAIRPGAVVSPGVASIHGEVAAYRLMHRLQPVRPPRAALVEFDGRDGVLIEWIDSEWDPLSSLDEVLAFDEGILGVNLGDAIRTVMFDWLVGNSDRHMRQFLVSLSGEVTSIDYGAAFSVSRFFLNRQPGEIGAFHALNEVVEGHFRNFAEMPGLDQGEFIDEIRGALDEIDDFVNRVEALSDDEYLNLIGRGTLLELARVAKQDYPRQFGSFGGRTVQEIADEFENIVLERKRFLRDAVDRWQDELIQRAGLDPSDIYGPGAANIRTPNPGKSPRGLRTEPNAFAPSGGHFAKRVLVDEDGNHWFFKSRPKDFDRILLRDAANPEVEVAAAQFIRRIGAEGIENRLITYEGVQGNAAELVEDLLRDSIGDLLNNPGLFEQQGYDVKGLFATLARAQVVDYVLGNNDAHAGNFILRGSGPGAVRLVPVDKGRALAQYDTDMTIRRRVERVRAIQGGVNGEAYKELWRLVERDPKRFGVDFGQVIAPLIREIESLSDADLERIFAPAIEAILDAEKVPKASRAGRRELYLKNLRHRRDNVRGDFEAFLSDLSGRKRIPHTTLARPRGARDVGAEGRFRFSEAEPVEVPHIGGDQPKALYRERNGKMWMVKKELYAPWEAGLVQLQRRVGFPEAPHAEAITLPPGAYFGPARIPVEDLEERRRYVAQEWIPSKTLNAAIPLGGEASPDQILDFARNLVFDHFIGNADAHRGNFIVLPNGRVLGIDKGGAEPEEFHFELTPEAAERRLSRVGNTYRWYLEDQLSRSDFRRGVFPEQAAAAIVEAIESLSDEELDLLFAPFLRIAGGPGGEIIDDPRTRVERLKRMRGVVRYDMDRYFRTLAEFHDRPYRDNFLAPRRPRPPRDITFFPNVNLERLKKLPREEDPTRGLEGVRRKAVLHDPQSGAVALVKPTRRRPSAYEQFGAFRIAELLEEAAATNFAARALRAAGIHAPRATVGEVVIEPGEPPVLSIVLEFFTDAEHPGGHGGGVTVHPKWEEMRARFRNLPGGTPGWGRRVMEPLDEKMREDLYVNSVVDLFLVNKDVHAGNFIIHDGRVVGVDKGITRLFAASQQDNLRESLYEALYELPPEEIPFTRIRLVAQEIASWTKEDIEAIVSPIASQAARLSTGDFSAEEVRDELVRQVQRRQQLFVETLNDEMARLANAAGRVWEPVRLGRYTDPELEHMKLIVAEEVHQRAVKQVTRDVEVARDLIEGVFDTNMRWSGRVRVSSLPDALGEKDWDCVVTIDDRHNKDAVGRWSTVLHEALHGVSQRAHDGLADPSALKHGIAGTAFQAMRGYQIAPDLEEAIVEMNTRILMPHYVNELVSRKVITSGQGKVILKKQKIREQHHGYNNAIDRLEVVRAYLGDEKEGFYARLINMDTIDRIQYLQRRIDEVAASGVRTAAERQEAARYLSYLVREFEMDADDRDWFDTLPPPPRAARQVGDSEPPDRPEVPLNPDHQEDARARLESALSQDIEGEGQNRITDPKELELELEEAIRYETARAREILQSGVSVGVRVKLAERGLRSGVIDLRPAIQVLEEGRIKSQFETGISSGLLNPEFRAEVEETLFGYDPNLPVEDRPIYGYIFKGDLSDPDHFTVPGGDVARYTSEFEAYHSGARGYGDVLFVLKASVHKRTTITAQDSLNYDVIHGNTAPRPLLRPDWMLGEAIPGGGQRYRGPSEWGLSAEQDFKARALGAGYVEAQIHGGVTLDDVAFVFLDIRPDQYDDTVITLVKLLEAKGVPYRFRIVPTGRGV